MTQQIKVGDRVRGWSGQIDGNRRVGPPHEGVVEDVTPHIDILKIRANGRAAKYVWLSTAELLSHPLPLPKPIDWSKPVQFIGKTKKVSPAKVMTTEWKAKGFPGEHLVLLALEYEPNAYCSQLCKQDGTPLLENEGYAENIPPEPKRRKAAVVMNKNGTLSLYQGQTVANLKKYGHNIVAGLEIELVEGEGVA